MNYKLVSIKTIDLSRNIINEICKLKDLQWNYGINSQLQWFKKNIKKDDMHNLLYYKLTLIGYTLLRKRTYYLIHKVKKKKYLLFDTLVLHKNFRNKKLSNLMMFFNNFIIKESGFLSFLICKDNLVDFYKIYNWTKIDKKNFRVLDHEFSTNGMLLNEKKTKRYHFYFNR